MNKLSHEEKMIEKYLNHFFSENYKMLIGNFNESQNKISLLFYNYTQVIDTLIQFYEEDLFALESGCISEEIKIKTEAGEITLSYDSPYDDIIKYKRKISRVLYEKLQNYKAKADNIFFEITNKIDSGEIITFAEFYKMAKGFNEIKEIVNKNQKIDTLQMEYRPQYINDLIEDGYIMPDGKTAIKSLREITRYLRKKGIEVTAVLLSQFRKKDGKPFTERTRKTVANLW